MHSALTVVVPAAPGQIREHEAGVGGKFTGKNLLGEAREGTDSHRSSRPTWLPGGVENSPWRLSHQPPPVGMRPRCPTLPCKLRCAPKGAAVGGSTGTWVPCGMCWGGPCMTAGPGNRYWGEVAMELGRLLSTAEPKCSPQITLCMFVGAEESWGICLHW